MAASPRDRELARLHRGARVRRYPSVVARWLAGWLRAPRPAAIDPVPPVEPGQVAVTFVGHASLIVRYPGLAIAIDPVLGGWLGPIRRATAAGATAATIADVGLILITHAAAGHLHPASLRRLPRAAAVVVPRGAGRRIQRLGFTDVVELAPGAALTRGAVAIEAVAVGAGLAYLVRGDGPSVLACGAGGYGPAFAELGARAAPDVAALPIGGFVPASFRARHMSPLDALYAFEDLRARALIPVRHGAFALSYERLDEPARWLVELARARGVRDHVLVMTPGQTERFVVAAPPVVRAPARAAPAGP